MIDQPNTLIRGTLDYSFRTGEWAYLVGLKWIAPEGRDSRLAFEVVFIDGVTDFWPVIERFGAYEFSEAPGLFAP